MQERFIGFWFCYSMVPSTFECTNTGQCVLAWEEEEARKCEGDVHRICRTSCQWTETLHCLAYCVAWTAGTETAKCGLANV